MKEILFFGVIFLTALRVPAQTGVTVIKNMSIIGKNLSNNKEIQAKEYVFPERIDNYVIDTSANILILKLRGISKNGKRLNQMGDLVLYDLLDNKIKWTKEIDYYQSNVMLNKNVIVQNQGNKTFSLNLENGKELWKLKNTIYYVESLRKIGLGYNYISMNKYTNLLQGIDLSNGNSLWNRMVYRLYGWNEVLHLKDSVIVIVAAGLHWINLDNGTGWDYSAVTGMQNYTPPSGLATGAASVAAGVALGMLTGFFFVASVGNNTVREVVSNVMVYSSDIYFASKEKISRLGHDGQIKWTQPLPEDLTSNSSIFIKDSMLYLVNKGYASFGNRKINFGTPFITSFDLDSGKQIFMSTIKGKKDKINGFTVRNDTLLLVLEDRVSKYSMTNGSIISEKSFDVKSLGEFDDFIGKQVYIKKDSIYKSLVSSDSTKYYLHTNKGKILITDSNLNILEQIDPDQIFVYYLRTKDFKFLVRGNETIVLDNNYKEVADLKVSGNSILVGSKLFNIQEKSFIEIDLNDLIKN